uniref:Uncharacterized protein n=1 Tax=Arundo donax TaxID=35708 RepID=A0A0A9BRJ7_ARUDO
MLGSCEPSCLACVSSSPLAAAAAVVLLDFAAAGSDGASLLGLLFCAVARAEPVLPALFLVRYRYRCVSSCPAKSRLVVQNSFGGNLS